MITGLLSFLGGNVFRMIFGEIIAFLNKRQDHALEMERMRLQAEQDAAQHARNLEAITIQAQLGVQTIAVQAQAAVGEIEAQGWLSVVNATTRSVGIAWIDGWNATIRPAVATWAVVMMTLGELGVVASLSEDTIAVCGVALGIYLADRSLMKRGK